MTIPPPQPLATTDLLSVSTDLALLDVSYKQNHTTHGLVCLASLTQRVVSRSSRVVAHFIPFRG